MSIYVTTLVWKFSRSSGSTLLTALAIADHADDEGFAYPAVATLAKKARVSERTIQYALAELQDLQELDIERGTGPKGCNTFHIRVDTLRRGANPAGGANSAGVQNTTKGGATGCTQTVIEPSEEEGVGATPTPDASKTKPKAEKVELVQTEAGTWELLVPLVIREQYAKAYPGVDIPQQIALADAWINANLSRKPKSQASRFLNGWMNRAFQDLRSPQGLRVVGGRAHRPAATKQEKREVMSSWLFPDNHQQQGAPDVVDVVATEVR